MEGKIANFVKQVEKETGLDKCPFLVNWFNSKTQEFLDSPGNPSRKGIPSGEKLPLPGMKKLLALFKTVHPKLKLKDFADASPTSYVLIRSWATDNAFSEFMNKLDVEYAALYCERLSQLCKFDNADRVCQHINELRYYKNILILVGIIGGINRLVENDSGTDIGYTLNLVAACRHKAYVLSSAGSLMANDRLHKESVIEAYTGLKAHSEGLYGALKALIPKRNTQVCIPVIKMLQEFTADILDDLVACKIELFDLKSWS